MNVIGIGNVYELNPAYIFYRDEAGKQLHCVTTKKHCEDIFNKAHSEMLFWDRVMDELLPEYERRKEHFYSHYHYLSDEELQEIRRTESREVYFQASLRQISQNEEYQRKGAEVFGFGQAWGYAFRKKEEARVIFAQAKRALERFK